MDILTVLQTIARRWLIVLPIVVATFVAAFMVGTGTKPEYAVEGTALLVSESDTPSAATEPSTVMTAAVLAEVLRSTEVRDRLTQGGATVPYVVEVDPITSILRVSAASPDPAANFATVQAVLDNLDAELGRLEEGAEVPGDRRASVKLLLRPSDRAEPGAPVTGSAFLVQRGLTRTNPYSPSPYTTRIIEELMVSSDARQRVADLAGTGATFTVTQRPRDPAPIVSISALSIDPRLAERTFEAVTTTIGEMLDERQATANVEDQTRTRLSLLNAPAGAVKTPGTVVKSVVIVVGLGLIAAATAAILAESLLASRAKGESKVLDRGAAKRGASDEPGIGATGAEEPPSLAPPLFHRR